MYIEMMTHHTDLDFEQPLAAIIFYREPGSGIKAYVAADDGCDPLCEKAAFGLFPDIVRVLISKGFAVEALPEELEEGDLPDPVGDQDFGALYFFGDPVTDLFTLETGCTAEKADPLTAIALASQDIAQELLMRMGATPLEMN